jgi:DNA-binding transcriptional MerR regulator
MQRAVANSQKQKERASYPDKLFYKIGEVSRIAGVEPYVLRYWESEFQFLKPRKSKSGQRIYIKKDLELVLRIKEMLYQERYTIEGVRKRFLESGNLNKPSVQKSKVISSSNAIEHVKSRLREILQKID